MIIGVFNTKGGVGKSTLALNLAVGLAKEGRDVLAIDGDRQATLMKSIGQRDAEGVTPALAVAHFIDGPLLRSQVMQATGKYQDIVIDAGGRDSTAMRAGLMVADVVIVPFQPRSFDVWAVDDIADLVKEARSMRDGLTVYAVLNGADPQGRDNMEAAEAVAEIDGIEYLNAAIGRRKALADLAGMGLGILDRPDRDRKAAGEISYLLQSITDQVDCQEIANANR